MDLWLVDTNREVVEAWRRHFAGLKDVYVRCDDILAVAEGALVSPANSYGWMDGGIDEHYTRHFGIELQARLQREIALQKDGKLPVGSALLVPTGHARIPYLISAPTMEMPGPLVSPENCYFAMSAALKVAARNARLFSKIFCPGLATGIGGVGPDEAAREMANAYRSSLQ